MYLISCIRNNKNEHLLGLRQGLRLSILDRRNVLLFGESPWDTDTVTFRYGLATLISANSSRSSKGATKLGGLKDPSCRFYRDIQKYIILYYNIP